MAFSLLTITGSLWFAGLLLMLLLVGMAYATVFESTHGTERALVTFYGAWWFKALLGLLGVNILASIAVRLPITRRRVGFVFTHGGLLAIMLGAMITILWGVDGQIAVTEGETIDSFQDRRDVLELVSRRDQSRTQVELTDAAFRGFAEVDQPRAPRLMRDGLAVEVLRYLPDSAAVERVVDDNPRRQPAVEVAFGPAGAAARWVFADQPVTFGAWQIAYRVVDGPAELEQLLALDAGAQETGVGRLKIVAAGQTHEFAVEDCTESPAALSGSGLSVRVLRYLPHATVGADRQVVSASNQPINPAVEIEISGPDGSERRVCFAKFPDFQSMHGRAAHSDVNATFVASAAATPTTPIELIGASDGRTFVRFAPPSAPVSTQELTLGNAAQTPWAGQTLTLVRRFERARIDQPLEAVTPVRTSRMPAVLLKLTTGDESSEMWVQRGISRPVSVHGAPYEIRYGDRSTPLTFTLRLNDFRVVYYPGGRQPRSFESSITLADPATGETREQVVSMNHPVKFGGYTLYQSSYNESGGAALSVLSIARDPGQPLVFAGYILTFVGMIVVLNNRLREQRLMHAATQRATRAAGEPAGAHAPPRRPARAGQAVAVGLVLLAAHAACAADLPRTLDVSPVRSMVVQSDGRWMPLDTVARDVVESVTGEPVYAGHDPVLVLLAWTFDPQSWMAEPLICIANAELRGELQLHATQTEFSYSELVRHQPLMDQIDALARRTTRGKLNPLESKVSDIHEKLNTLHTTFGGFVIRPIPDPAATGAAWKAFAELRETDSPSHRAVLECWSALRGAFLADNAAAFAQAADSLNQALATLPAAYRPPAKRIATELRSNRLQPFHMAWMIMVAGAALAAVALVMRRRMLDVLAGVALVAGFVVLSYGLYLRWQIAGRIPAANMYESLLFLSWGMGAFAILSMALMRDRVVLLTASSMGAVALLLADVLPLDGYIRPIPPVLQDTVWMSIHVPVIMVSYSVLALAMLIAHAQMVVMAVSPARQKLVLAIDRLHYWYVHVGAILLLAGIATGSMWAASSWGRYWGWDPKEVWSLVALLAYLTILHVRVDRQAMPGWARGVGAMLLAAVLVLIARQLAPLTPAKVAALAGAAGVIVFFVTVRGEFATALKSVLAFWTIIMTYLGVNYVLGIGLHSYGFGTGAMVHHMMLIGGIDLAFALLCGGVYLARRQAAPARGTLPARAAPQAC